MVLAELELFHSRPIAPTRRVALGTSVLPVDPAPGLGGILLGGVVAKYSAELSADALSDLKLLAGQLERGLRIVQPRVRHRLQTDRVGLLRSRHRLIGTDGAVEFRFDGDQGAPTVHVLAALYAAGEQKSGPRPAVFDVVRRATTWRRPIGPDLVAFLSGRFDPGSVNWSAAAYENPTEWALDVLGFEPSSAPPRQEIQARFREMLRLAHPDHGGTGDDAAERIAEISAARQVLL